MKKLMIIIAVASFSLQASAQLEKDSLNSPSYFLQKSKNQKTAGWVLLGGGVVAGSIGFAIAAGNAFNEIAASIDNQDDNNFVAGTVLLITGTVMMAASIPFFVSAAHNKRKSVSLTFTRQKGNYITAKSSVTSPYPALSFKIDLDKVFK